MDSTDAIALAALAMSGVAVVISAFAARYARRQALAAEAAVPLPPPEVAWELERRPDGFMLLRNVGTRRASGVHVHLPDRYSRNSVVPLGNEDVERHGSIRIRWYTAWTWPDLNEIAVSWDGQEEPVMVPVPPKPPK